MFLTDCVEKVWTTDERERKCLKSAVSLGLRF